MSKNAAKGRGGDDLASLKQRRGGAIRMVSGDKAGWAGWAGWHDKLLGRKTVEQLIELALSSNHYCATL